MCVNTWYINSTTGTPSKDIVLATHLSRRLGKAQRIKAGRDAGEGGGRGGDGLGGGGSLEVILRRVGARYYTILK